MPKTNACGTPTKKPVFTFLPSKLSNMRTNAPLPGNPHNLSPHNHVHDSQPDNLGNHIALGQPLFQPRVIVDLDTLVLGTTRRFGRLGSRLFGLLSQHYQFANLDCLVRLDVCLDELARFLETSLHAVDDNGAAFFCMLVEMSVFVVRCHGVFYYVWVKFDHVRFVAADQRNVATLFAALGVQQVMRWEQRLRAGCSAENDICAANIFL